MKIVLKLILSYLLVAALASLTAFSALRSYQNIDAAFGRLINDPLPAIKLLEELKISGSHIVSSTSEIRLIYNESDSLRNDRLFEEEQQLINSGYGRYDESLKLFEKLVVTSNPGEMEFLKTIKETGDSLKKTSQQILEMQKKGGTGKEILELSEKFDEQEKAYLQAVNTAETYEYEQMITEQQNVQATISNSTLTTYLITFLTFILAIISGIYISRLISNRIIKLKVASEKVGRGELETYIEIKTHDEIGDLARSFNNMIRDLKESRFNLAVAKNFTDKIMDSMVDFVVVVNMDLTIAQVNKAALRINGYEEHELIGQSINMLIADKHYTQKGVDILREKGFIKNFDKLNLNKDGSITPISMSLSILKDDQGQELGIVCVGKDTSERKQAEEEMERLNRQLESQRQRLDNIIANMPGIVWEVTVERDGITQNVDFVSNYVETMLGYGVEEWLSTPNFWLSIIHPDDREKTEREAYANYAAGKSSTHEFRWIAKDNRIIWVESRSEAICNDKGQPIGLRGVVLDVTERKKAEEALRENESKFRDLFDNAPVAYHELDKDGRFTRINRTEELLLGYTNEELKGRHPAEIIVEKVSLEATRAKLAGTQPLKPVERTFIRKDGSLISVLNEDRLIYDPEGNIAGIRSTLQDITDRKQAESELIEAQHFLRKVIDTVPNLIFVKNRAGQFTLVNQAFADTHGRTVEDIIGKNPADLISNEEEAKIIELDDQHIFESNQEKTILEHKITDAKGSLHWFHTVKRPLISPGKKIQYLLGVATDLTDRKLLEEQLQRAQKLESVGQLAAGIAHEINTPTQYVSDNVRFLKDAFEDIATVVKKNEELLKICQDNAFTHQIISEMEDAIKFADTEYLMEEAPKAIEQALVGIGRIGKIVQSMKDFAHPGSNDKQVTDLNRAIDSTITVAGNEWKYVAEMITDFDPNLPPVPCLIGEFNQVILNMIVNAAHAIADVVGDGGKGKGTIKISTQLNEDQAEIRISDTGAGIKEEIRKKIFDPLFTTKEIGKGTGQGLAISHSVVTEKHKGTITLESEIGKGTTFIINLPLNDSDELN